MLHGVTLKLKGLLEGRLFWRKDKPGFDILKVFDEKLLIINKEWIIVHE